jgi:hypothetical protein
VLIFAVLEVIVDKVATGQQVGPLHVPSNTHTQIYDQLEEKVLTKKCEEKFTN